MITDRGQNSGVEIPGTVEVVYPLDNEAGDVTSRSPHHALILLGAPGCGKGTLTGAFQSMLGYSVFSSGNALRAEIASGSQLGQQAKDLCDQGLLVPDSIIFDMVQEFLATNHKASVVFDGFPRTLSQATELTKMLTGWTVQAFYLQASDAVVFDRMLGRYSCKTCGKLYNERTVVPKISGVCDVCGGADFARRDDDNEHSIRTRLTVYHEMTMPVLDYYSDRGELLFVDASQAPDIVSKDVFGVILRSL
jgi:adenylate kinase